MYGCAGCPVIKRRRTSSVLKPSGGDGSRTVPGLKNHGLSNSMKDNRCSVMRTLLKWIARMKVARATEMHPGER